MRYLPISDTDRQDMLRTIGAANIDALFVDIPSNKRINGNLDLPLGQSEMDVERQLMALSAKNLSAGSVPFFCGAGAYKHHVPATVDHLIQRSEFLTSYTPYQPEIAQGTLQYLFEFQTQVALLTGMDVANASMYDGSTACAEAVLMAHRVSKKRKSILSGTLHPHYVETTRTLSELANDTTLVLPPCPGGVEDILSQIDDETSCVVVQSPSFYGDLIDLKPIADKAHAHGALLIAVFTEAFSLGLVESPGAQGADIVVGEGQSIGNALNFGGPYVGLFATKDKFVRQMPGRLCGETSDSDGKRGYVLTLSTREQHIRRDKATSNICTNSGLCALAFTVHMTLLGDQGLTRTAKRCHVNAVKLGEALNKIDGVEILNDTFFNEFTLRLPKRADAVVEALMKKGILGGVPVSRLEPKRDELANLLLVASTEVNTDDDRAAFVAALKEVL